VHEPRTQPKPQGPGALVVFGSGETAEVGRLALEWLSAERGTPRLVALLETPAGFELNCGEVTARWSKSIRRKLPRSEVVQLPLRRRGTPLSPDDAELARPLLIADLIALGAGSPTYTVRQLRDTVAWRYIQGAHVLGADLFLASAGAIAAGRYVLPVYEIFKVGDDPHWKDGLDLLSLYGVAAAIVPHWNNADGGVGLDTSRCFVGRDRFEFLASALPQDAVIVGVDDNTALAINPSARTAHVLGRGDVTVHYRGTVATYPSGSAIGVDLLGQLSLRVPAPIPPGVTEEIASARRELLTGTAPAEVDDLIRLRERAREKHEWARADALREQIARRGWRVEDTERGPRLRPESVATVASARR
jgi:hypothetical protein